MGCGLDLWMDPMVVLISVLGVLIEMGVDGRGIAFLMFVRLVSLLFPLVSDSPLSMFDPHSPCHSFLSSPPLLHIHFRHSHLFRGCASLPSTTIIVPGSRG